MLHVNKGTRFFLVVSLTFFPISALAHNVKTSGNVAATFHIQPNHNPKAGEKSQAWFALTKQGGARILLEQCDCQLEVYGDQRTGDPPVLRPVLKSISAEQYRGIPGAEIMFPKAGIYELELSGKAKDGQSFEPFELSYEVTVQAGQVATPAAASGSPTALTSPQQVTQAADPAFNAMNLLPVGAAIVVLGGAFWFLKRK